MFYFGRPSNGSHEIEDVTSYKAYKNLKIFHEAGGYDEGYHDIDYFYYEVESREKHQIGDDIWIKDKKLYANQYSAYATKDEVIYKYRLCRKNGVWQTKLYNSLIGGASLEGKVLAVEGEKVKLHLDIDENQSKDEASWFPYAPPTGNAMYSMPIVGTSARLYFPNEASEDPIITGCVRTNGSSCAKTADTSKRYFGTEHGSAIEMFPDLLSIKGGSKEPLSISFDDKVGVTLKSPKKLSLNADDEIIMKTMQSVKISAQSQILVSKTGTQSSLSVETDMHFKSGNVINDGSCRDTSSPYKDEPKAGKKPDPPPPPKVEKKGFDWGKLALAALVVVAVVASVFTFGVAATLIGAAVGAAEGAKNNIDSQLSKNGGDKSKIDKGEVLKAAFFGAVTGAKDMLLTETCTVADWCAQTVLGIITLASMAAEYIPFGGNYKDIAESVTKDIQNLASDVHQFYKDASPYKEAFEYGEIVLDAASIPALVESAPKIGGKIVNIVSRAINPGRMQLLNDGRIVISAGSREAVALSASDGTGAMIGFQGLINMAKSISDGGNSGGENSNFDDFDPKSGTNKQKGNFGESKSADNKLNNQEIKDAGYDLKQVGRDAPAGPDDKIVKGIDGLYENENVKYVVDEAKFGSSKLGKTKDGPQMSDDWLKGSDRILKAVDGDEELARKISKALDRGEVERVLTKIDKEGNVTTYRLDGEGKVIGTWP